MQGHGRGGGDHRRRAGRGDQAGGRRCREQHDVATHHVDVDRVATVENGVGRGKYHVGRARTDHADARIAGNLAHRHLAIDADADEAWHRAQQIGECSQLDGWRRARVGRQTGLVGMALGVAHDDVATGFEARRAGHAQRREGEVDRQGVDTRATERCDDVLWQLARALEGVTARHLDASVGRIGGRVQIKCAACEIRPEVRGQQLIERRAFGQHDGAHIAQARRASLRAAVLKHHIDVVASDQ